VHLPQNARGSSLGFISVAKPDLLTFSPKRSRRQNAKRNTQCSSCPSWWNLFRLAEGLYVSGSRRAANSYSQWTR